MTQGPIYRQLPRKKRLLPEKYLEQGYFSTDYILHDRLIIDDPRRIAATFTDINMELEDKAMEYNQFRKFYDFIRQIERRLKWGEPWGKARQDVLRLNVHAADSCRRGVAPRVFLEFMEKNVKLASDIQKSEPFLKGFIIHMESIIGFWPK